MATKYYHIFLVDREKGNDTDGKLRFRVRWGCNTVAFNLGYRVEFAKWSRDTQRCRNGTSHGREKVSAAEINREISFHEKAAEEVERGFAASGIVPDKEQYRAEFLRIARGADPGKPGGRTMLELIDDFMREMGVQNGWAAGTYEKLATLKRHLADFDPGIAFHKLDERGLLRYTQFLQQRYGQRNTTTLKQIDILKWFLRWAKRKGFNTTLDFEQFRPKLKTAARKVVFLDWDELMALYNFKLPPGKKYLERVRDVFCLCCFTGLRYSDVANLKKSDIADGCITITTVKTHDTLTIELNDYSAEILSRYSATDCGGDAAMPVISNQRMNDYLKELGEVCGIDTPVTMTYYKGGQRHDETHPKYELLTTHCGRRTFICNALMLGIPPEIVMKWTGHSDYKAMKPYIAVTDNAKRKAMSLFNKKKD